MADTRSGVRRSLWLAWEGLPNALWGASGAVLILGHLGLSVFYFVLGLFAAVARGVAEVARDRR